jgi:hypothetical protein
VALDLLRSLSRHATSLDSREGKFARFLGHVPSAAPLAYLHIVFKPADSRVLAEVALRLRMPRSCVDFLKVQNGANLFLGALDIYGVHEPGQLLNRQDPFSRLPFNIEVENRNWGAVDSREFLAIAGYEFDGSQICISRSSEAVYLFEGEADFLTSEPSMHWPNFDEWITLEIARLAAIFGSGYGRLPHKSKTVPRGQSN